MHRTHIEDLSAIAERKSHEESQRTFDDSKPQQVRCPQNGRENYQCPICTRLRAVCPYTKLSHCLHENKERVYRSDYFMEKSSLSTLAGERQRTASNHDALRYEQSRREVIRVNEVRPQPVTKTQVVVSPAEEIIYYPVIYNNYVVSPNLEKSRQSTPMRVKHSRRVDYSDDVILTPTQVKEMLYSNKE